MHHKILKANKREGPDVNINTAILLQLKTILAERENNVSTINFCSIIKVGRLLLPSATRKYIATND